MYSSDKLREFGVGQDSVVGINFQTDPQDHWRGGLQGLTCTHSHVQAEQVIIRHITLKSNIFDTGHQLHHWLSVSGS